jgi:predicted negative regulator of RcsB-dependent stress response
LRPSVNKDQQKAMDFFNRYNKEQESVEQQHEGFKNNTKQFFSQDFKGFDFNLGEKSFRYRVTNPEAIADKQSNITNLIKKFLDKDGQVADVKGYHKAIYAADNADSLAKHFYEQGKADALKEVVAKSNNISTEPRQNAGNLNIGGFKVRAINGVDTSKLRIQKKY